MPALTPTLNDHPPTEATGRHVRMALPMGSASETRSVRPTLALGSGVHTKLSSVFTQYKNASSKTLATKCTNKRKNSPKDEKKKSG